MTAVTLAHLAGGATETVELGVFFVVGRLGIWVPHVERPIYQPL